MKIFITGALGFVGYHVLRELRSSSNFHVVAFDRKRFEESLLPERIGNIKYCRGNTAELDDAIIHELNDTDVVIHLASLVHDARVSKQQHIKVNYVATQNLLHKFLAVSKSPIKQFIFISTVAVFGNYKESEYNENDECRPDTPYGASKLLAEQFIRSVSEQKKGAFKYTIFRLATVFGRRDKGNIGKMIGFVKKCHFFPIFDQDAKKSFVYVKDVARAILSCVNNERAFNETFIISAAPLTMRKMLDDIASVFRIKCMMIKMPISVFGRLGVAKKLSRNNIYSNKKGTDKLGFIARDFKSGLSDMICRSGGR